MSWLEKFSYRNRRRCESPNGFNHLLSDWSLSDWMVALTGEVGEANNFVKKLNRIRDNIPGNKDGERDKGKLLLELKKELADIYIYLDLIIQKLDCTLPTIVEEKFKETSEKVGYEDIKDAN